MSTNASYRTIFSTGLFACGIALAMTGANAAAEDLPPPTTAETVPLPGETPAPGQVPSVTGEVDLIGDKTDATGAAKPASDELLNELTPVGPLNPTARRCYVLLGFMKENIEKISRDLDNNGKEVERLIRTSDELSKNVTELAGLWPDDQFFRDACINTKRQILVLNDELARVPRKWTHVRWSFNASLREVSKLRLRSRDMAESEPKPMPVIGKDGKPVTDKNGNLVFVEAAAPEVDPLVARREKALREVEAARDQERNRSEERKKKKMAIDLDSGSK